MPTPLRLVVAILLAFSWPVVSTVALAQSQPSAAAPAPAEAAPPIRELPKRGLYVSAYFSEGGAQVKSGLKWRVFRAKNDESGKMPVVAESVTAAPSFLLEPGVYIVHVAYGLAAATRRVEMGDTTAVEKLVLNAGGLKVEATIRDQAVPTAMLTSRIHAILPSGERRLIAENVPAETITRL